MKKFILFSFIYYMIFSFSVVGMSKPDRQKKSETIIATPVYLGNAPFEKLAIKVSPKNGKPEVFLQIEFSEDSNVTENEIAALQGYKVKFWGYTENKPGEYSKKTFILTGYKKL